MNDPIIGYVYMDEATEKAVRAVMKLGHQVYVEYAQINYQTAISVYASQAVYAMRPCPICKTQIPGNVTVCGHCEREGLSLGEELTHG